MGYVTNQNRIKLMAATSFKSVFRWIFSYSYFTFNNVCRQKKREKV